MSGAFPFSPAPSSPSYSDASSPRPDERRRSKRDSASSQTRQREEAAARYPSPPVGTRSRPQSIEASLQIPPYNPNRRGAPPSPSPSAPSRTRSDTSSTFDGDRLGGLMPAPRISAPHQTTHRSASAAVIPVASPIPSHVSGTSASSRVRQSVGYLPAQSTADGAGPHPQLYTPHPMPRQKIFFGPYILLQTLGEGEFGKVKLGIHSERWGEEVAIKLIKRGNVDTAQRGEKVRREIEVLKVRLSGVEQRVRELMCVVAGGSSPEHCAPLRRYRNGEVHRYRARVRIRCVVPLRLQLLADLVASQAESSLTTFSPIGTSRSATRLASSLSSSLESPTCTRRASSTAISSSRTFSSTATAT